VASTAAAAGPDRTLYLDAQKAQTQLEKSRQRQALQAEWEKVVLAYRRVVARYPRSPYCDNALLAVGNLYRQMAGRFGASRYDDAVKAYRMVVSEYPSSSLGESALHSAFEIIWKGGGPKQVREAGRRYLRTYPSGKHAKQVQEQMRNGGNGRNGLPATPRPGLAQVFNLRSWTGETSTRVVLDLDRQVKLKYSRIGNPDRLWIDLIGSRLHPNLTDRSFPVGDGLLEKVRIGPNREGVVRMVLDLRSVSEHNMFYLQDPPRLVVDVHANATRGKAVASTRKPATRPASRRTTSSPTRAPTRPAPKPPELNRAGDRSLARQLGLGARRIVIDPGHGGHDPGSIGRGGLQEKDLVLDVSMRLAKLVRRELGADVIMTRSTDKYLPLEERTAIANSKGADLFLSIHANSSRSRKARGVETYYLNFATDPHAEAVAARENAISQATLTDLQSLVKAITLNSKIDESRDFATSVHEAVVTTMKPTRNRGVRTAPFYVLIGASMPSILAEIAFLSHPAEEKLLRSSDYRQRLAQALLEGVRRYLEALSPTQTQRLTAQAEVTTVVSPKGGTRR